MIEDADKAFVDFIRRHSIEELNSNSPELLELATKSLNAHLEREAVAAEQERVMNHPLVKAIMEYEQTTIETGEDLKQ